MKKQLLIIAMLASAINVQAEHSQTEINTRLKIVKTAYQAKNMIPDVGKEGKKAKKALLDAAKKANNIDVKKETITKAATKAMQKVKNVAKMLKSDSQIKALLKERSANFEAAFKAL